jgi:hypothetical protein
VVWLTERKKFSFGAAEEDKRPTNVRNTFTII